MKRLLPGVLPALLLSACSTVDPEPTVCLPVPEVVCPVCSPVQQCPDIAESANAVPAPVQTAGELHLPIIGAVEWASIEPGDVRMEARIDTGAASTSLHAENVTLVERDGKRYVRFDVTDPATGESIPMEKRFKRRVLIKQTSGDLERRYVVRMWITLGEVRARVDVTLSNREGFEFPLLIGRNFLTDTMIVDVSQQYVLGR